MVGEVVSVDKEARGLLGGRVVGNGVSIKEDA